MQQQHPTPWYKQFWPWFIIFFPASAVVAGLITVGIAIENSDTLVKDNWYKDGLAINQRLDKQKQAKDLKISARVQLDRANKQLSLTLNNIDGLQVNTLKVAFVHPTQPEKDSEIQAFYTPQGRFVAQLPSIPNGFYHLRIGANGAGVDNPQWQLDGGVNFSNKEIDSTIQPR